jgi:hypothetical protein
MGLHAWSTAPTHPAALGAAALALRRGWPKPECGPRDTPNLIFPGDPRWAVDFNVYPAASNLATIAITPTNPRSGNGSLELATTGSLFDWAFFKRVADANGSWGLLSDVNCLTFDWWRDSYTLPNPAPPNSPRRPGRNRRRAPSAGPRREGST